MLALDFSVTQEQQEEEEEESHILGVRIQIQIQIQIETFARQWIASSGHANAPGEDTIGPDAKEISMRFLLQAPHRIRNKIAKVKCNDVKFRL